MAPFVLDKIWTGASAPPSGERVASEAKVLLGFFGREQIFSNFVAHVRLLWLRVDGSVSDVIGMVNRIWQNLRGALGMLHFGLLGLLLGWRIFQGRFSFLQYAWTLPNGYLFSKRLYAHWMTCI